MHQKPPSVILASIFCRDHTLLQDCAQRTLLAASDISQSFFAHLDQNIPALCIVTVVSHTTCCKSCPPVSHAKRYIDLILCSRLEHCLLLLEQVEEHCLCRSSTLSCNSVSPGTGAYSMIT